MTKYLELARTLKRLVGPDRGFVLLMQLGEGAYHYASSAERADVRQVLREWLARAGVVNARDLSGERSVDERLALEAYCAELGRRLESQGHRLALFLFDYGDGGSLAWYSNAPDPRAVVETFLDASESS